MLTCAHFLPIIKCVLHVRNSYIVHTDGRRSTQMARMSGSCTVYTIAGRPCHRDLSYHLQFTRPDQPPLRPDLSHLIPEYNPVRCLRSADKLLLTVPRTSLALSAKVFSVSAPAVWNSFSHLTQLRRLRFELSTYGAAYKCF